MQSTSRGFGRRLVVPHKSKKMVSSEVAFFRQSNFRRRHSELVRFSCFLKDLVAAGVLYLKSHFAARGGFVIGAIESERTHVNSLAGLVNWFLCGEENRNLVFEPDWLSEFR